MTTRKPVYWPDRVFDLNLHNDHFPTVVERLRGTASRLEEKMNRINHKRQQARPHSDQWTIKEQAGHLLQLESIWLKRVHNILNKEEVMLAADLENLATYEANYNEWTTGSILAAFRHARAKHTDLLDTMTDEHLTLTCMHPRLKVPMRLIDLAYFTAEHDDHHMALISWLEGQV